MNVENMHGEKTKITFFIRLN